LELTLLVLKTPKTESSGQWRQCPFFFANKSNLLSNGFRITEVYLQISEANICTQIDSMITNFF